MVYLGSLPPTTVLSSTLFDNIFSFMNMILSDALYEACTPDGSSVSLNITNVGKS